MQEAKWLAEFVSSHSRKQETRDEEKISAPGNKAMMTDMEDCFNVEWLMRGIEIGEKVDSIHAVV